MPAPGSTEGEPARAIEALLSQSDLVILGRMPYSSNATFLCELWPAGTRPDAGLDDTDQRRTPAPDCDDAETPLPHEGTAEATTHTHLGRAIYKPHQGERPLWDFPHGLYLREVAAYDLARAIGWDVVPPTVVTDGPFGPGSLQWFVEADFDQHYFTLLDDESSHPQLRRMAAFDLVANSTDRKGGHVLVDADRHLWGIDNGLCLHAEFKLRTVIWDFGGEPLPTELAEDLDRWLQADLAPEIAAVLDPFERDALCTRTRALLADGRLPTDPSGRRFPWPLV